MSQIKRLYSEKLPEYAVEADKILRDLRQNFSLGKLKGLRILNRYDIQGADEAVIEKAGKTIFSEPPIDLLYTEEPDFSSADFVLAVSPLPGQYDVRADFSAQSLQLISAGELPIVRTAKVYIFNTKGGKALDEEEISGIKTYLINPVEAEETGLSLPDSLEKTAERPLDIPKIESFTAMSFEELEKLHSDLGLAMSFEDLKFVQIHFMRLRRDPTLTEIRVLDTYWSDHCRHSSFNTEIKSLSIENADDNEGKNFKNRLISSLCTLQNAENEYYGAGSENRKHCLMDLATLPAKLIAKRGLMPDQDKSDEINACSIKRKVGVDGVSEDVLLMFKNETHNHPTEVEPFGGAATCLGGAIRDPLSGRAYVYQSMRLSGSGDPNTPVSETPKGKLPQRKITKTAAAGFSSYGNQIGIATGLVHEFYHPGYVAKRMELGAVVAAVPESSVRRGIPAPGDVICLVGGRTGADGIGGATGSSKVHDSGSLKRSGSEVQKGNPVTERALQRLFRKREVAGKIIRCNDFGAGGVAVAVGEIAPGIEIDLDLVPVKYAGLDGTMLAISESQERMAVCIKKEDLDFFISEASSENLDATAIARVTNDGKMKMRWRGETIVDIERSFIDTNGAHREAEAVIKNPETGALRKYFQPYKGELDFSNRLKSALSELNEASQIGLGEQFDSSIGSFTVLQPYGGSRQESPEEGMAAKIPFGYKKSDTASLMSFGFEPGLSDISPYHGAYLAVCEALAKLVCMGGDFRTARLSLQEYFPRTESPEKWGLPYAALLGAFEAQMDFETPAIGGKDSMSGNFEDLEVPPTLVCFAVNTLKSNAVKSSILNKPGKTLVLLPVPKNAGYFIDGGKYKEMLEKLMLLIKKAQVDSAFTENTCGAACAVAKKCFSENIGFEFSEEISEDMLFMPDPAAVICEVTADQREKISINTLKHCGGIVLGKTKAEPVFTHRGKSVSLDSAKAAWKKTLSGVFPQVSSSADKNFGSCEPGRSEAVISSPSVLTGKKPSVLIPVFPGTNCEDDMFERFTAAGAECEKLIFLNRTKEQLDESIKKLSEKIGKCRILALPGGFSAADEPEGSAKFICSVFRNPLVSESLTELIEEKDGLVLGICNGFQALIKLGLLPFGKIKDIEKNDPTLTFNRIGRHVSRYVRTVVESNNSPWLSLTKPGDIHTVAVSHGEGRFSCREALIKELCEKQMIATRYVDLDGRVTMEEPFNPNGSDFAVEGIFSPDGRIFGKMGHSERFGKDIAVNIPGEKDQKIFESGVAYFS